MRRGVANREDTDCFSIRDVSTANKAPLQGIRLGVVSPGFSWGRVWGLTPGLGRSEGTQKQQDQRGKTPYSQVLFSKVSNSPGVQSLTLDERMKYCTVHSAGRYRVYTDAIMEDCGDLSVFN